MFPKQSKIFVSGVLLFLLFVMASCGKPRLFGKEMEVHPIVKIFPMESKRALLSAKEALAYNGYNIQREDPDQGFLETHWQSTTSDSHYVKFFDRQDRGTVGAYHKLIVKVIPHGSNSKVEIYSLAKSFIANLQSTGIEEEKVLAKITDFTRKENIEVTNVGVQ